MSYRINYFGHYLEGTHDKVWGYVTLDDGSLYNFWGRRGKRLAFQKQQSGWEGNYELERRADAKAIKGYRRVSVDNIDRVWPDFQNEFEDQLVYAKLGLVRSDKSGET